MQKCAQRKRPLPQVARMKVRSHKGQESQHVICPFRYRRLLVCLFHQITRSKSRDQQFRYLGDKINAFVVRGIRAGKDLQPRRTRAGAGIGRAREGLVQRGTADRQLQPVLTVGQQPLADRGPVVVFHVLAGATEQRQPQKVVLRTAINVGPCLPPMGKNRPVVVFRASRRLKKIEQDGSTVTSVRVRMKEYIRLHHVPNLPRRLVLLRRDA